MPYHHQCRIITNAVSSPMPYRHQCRIVTTTAVIPAKAGIQFPHSSNQQPGAMDLDSVYKHEIIRLARDHN
jgi:hypothetical protein